MANLEAVQQVPQALQEEPGGDNRHQHVALRGVALAKSRGTSGAFGIARKGIAVIIGAWLRILGANGLSGVIAFEERQHAAK